MLPFLCSKNGSKKTFPPGTFIPTAARVCAIIQLCLVFSIFLWNAAQPFTSELFTLKSQLLLYQDVLGIPAQPDLPTDKQTRLAHNAADFRQLPEKQKLALLANYAALEVQLQRTFLDKFTRSVHILIMEIPPFELAWLVFSAVIAIMLLKRVEGAAQAVWLLPLLAALYAFDSRWQGTPPPQGEVHLYPTEQVLVDDYLKQPLSANIFEQQSQLQEAWKLYLVDAWAQQTPSTDPMLFEQQAQQGEFAFNVMRLENRPSMVSQARVPGKTPLEPLWLLSLYLFWNTYFAYTAWKRCA